MKVYVLCVAELFQNETFVDVASSLKKAQKKFRELYPYCRPWSGGDGHWNSASDNSDNPTLLFIHERELS